MTEENKAPERAEAPKKTRAKREASKPKAPKKESTRAGKLTDAQIDRFVASYAKSHDLTVKQAERAIMVRGAQRLATLARWSEKQS